MNPTSVGEGRPAIDVAHEHFLLGASLAAVLYHIVYASVPLVLSNSNVGDEHIDKVLQEARKIDETLRFAKRCELLVSIGLPIYFGLLRALDRNVGVVTGLHGRWLGVDGVEDVSGQVRGRGGLLIYLGLGEDVDHSHDAFDGAGTGAYVTVAASVVRAGAEATVASFLMTSATRRFVEGLHVGLAILLAVGYDLLSLSYSNRSDAVAMDLGGSEDVGIVLYVEATRAIDSVLRIRDNGHGLGRDSVDIDSDSIVIHIDVVGWCVAYQLTKTFFYVSRSNIGQRHVTL